MATRARPSPSAFQSRLFVTCLFREEPRHLWMSTAVSRHCRICSGPCRLTELQKWWTCRNNAIRVQCRVPQLHTSVVLGRTYSVRLHQRDLRSRNVSQDNNQCDGRFFEHHLLRPVETLSVQLEGHANIQQRLSGVFSCMF